MTDGNKVLEVGPAPHVHSGRSITAHYGVWTLGLTPALFACLASLGFEWAGLAALCSGSAVLFEYITEITLGQRIEISDSSALMQGLLLSMLIPASSPWWMALVGTAVMVVLGRQVFGGMGGYQFHPVLVAWAVLILSWPRRMVPIGDELPFLASGEALAVGGAALVLLGHIEWQSPLGFLSVVLLFHLAKALFGISPAIDIATASLAAFFLLPEPSCSPANKIPRLLYGCLAAILLLLLESFGTWEQPLGFAVLLSQMAAPLLDRIRPKPSREVCLK